MRWGPVVGLAAVVLAVLVAQVALAGGSDGASNAGLQHQITDLRAQVASLASAKSAKKKVRRGPRGPQGPAGQQGPPGPQGPGAISINRGGVPSGAPVQVLATVNGVEAWSGCDSFDFGFVNVGVRPHVPGDTVFASGDKAENGTLTSVQSSSLVGITATASSTVNLDVIAWSGSVGKLARFDLGGFRGSGCNIWGLVIPGS